MNENDLELERMKRRRQIAQAMLQQSMTPGQVQGQFVDPLSPIAKVLQALAGGGQLEAIDKEEKDLAGRQRDEVAAALSDYTRAVTPRPAQSGAAPTEFGMSEFDAPAHMPTGDDKRSAAMKLMSVTGGDPRDMAKAVVVDALKPQSDLAKIDPKDYTPESFAEYRKTGDPAKLRRHMEAPKPEALPSAVREYEYAKTQGYKGSFEDWQLAQRRAGATNVTATANAAPSKKFGEVFATKVAERDVDLLDAARKAPELATRANQVKQVIDSGKVITGAGADYRLALGKALNLVGASDPETIANTETLAVNLARNTLDAIKASGLGSGSGFSNADRDFLEKAAGGKINLEAATISRLADLSHRAARLSAEAWNTRVKDIPDSALEGTGIRRDPITVSPLFGAKPGGRVQLSPEVEKFLRDNNIPVPQ